MNINETLQKLNSLYDKENEIKKNIKLLIIEYDQIQEDKELLQTLIMYEANKNHRRGIK